LSLEDQLKWKRKNPDADLGSVWPSYSPAPAIRQLYGQGANDQTWPRNGWFSPSEPSGGEQLGQLQLLAD
jgi:hypothetical protein